MPFIVVILLLIAGTTAGAHPIRPDVVTIEFFEKGRYTIEVQTNLEAWLAGIGSQHRDTGEAPEARTYDRLRSLPPEELSLLARRSEKTLIDAVHPAFGSRTVTPVLNSLEIPQVGDTAFARLSTVVLGGPIPRGAEAFTWRMAESRGNHVIRFRNRDGEITASEWLSAGKTSQLYPLDHTTSPSFMQTVLTYTVAGFTHILPLGVDHVLFVLGIFLLSTRWGPLLWQVTSFTLAHSITLGLSLYGVVSLAPEIVEPLIALSIVYVGVENLLTRTLKPWRVGVVFLFGLLHGLGFAGVLLDIGLPESDFVTALVTFNIGVELGQLAVLCGAWLLLAAAFRHQPWYRSRIVTPGSLAIALVGLYWTVQRTFT